jgi:SHS2 domain-containing protein
MKNGFVEISHTADAAIKAWGRDFADLSDSAARGMYLILEVTSIAPIPYGFEFEINGVDRESLLVGFLTELLFNLYQTGQAFDMFTINDSEVGIIVKADKGYSATFRREIKAVTYHQMDITMGENGLETYIVFDV